MCKIDENCNCDKSFDIKNITELMNTKTLFKVNTKEFTVQQSTVGELQSLFNAGGCDEFTHFVNNIPMALELVKDSGDFETYELASKAMRRI